MRRIGEKLYCVGPRRGKRNERTAVTLLQKAKRDTLGH